MKKLFILFFWMVSFNTHAHQANLAAFKLNQSDDGLYTIQLIGSLTGFETAINQNYSQIGFESVEEFKALVVKLFAESLTLTINDKPVKLKQIAVTLGHQTSVTAGLVDVDKEIESIQLKNTFFKDILRNKIIVEFSGKDLPTEKYVLNKSNQYVINITPTNDPSKSLAKHQ